MATNTALTTDSIQALLQQRVQHLINKHPKWHQPLLHRLPHLQSSIASDVTSSSSSAPRVVTSPSSLTRFIDHTVLRNDATEKDITTLCQEAIEHNLYAVCVNGCHAAFASKLLNEANASAATGRQRIHLAVVVGFPLGANSSACKAFETRDAIAVGADEIDMVINLGWLLQGDYERVYEDVCSVVQAASSCSPTVLVKVIVEAAQLTAEHIIDACLLSALAGAHFVKTSTGFSAAGGASLQAVTLMKATVGDQLQVKASGGIRDAKASRAMIAAGANRLGVSATINILKTDRELNQQQAETNQETAARLDQTKSGY